MKKILATSTVLLGIFFLAGCGQQLPNQDKPTIQTPLVQQSNNKQLNNNDKSDLIIPNNWKTYKSKKFGFFISLPSDWKEVYQGDGSLNDFTDYTFDGPIFISSPDKNKNETMLFQSKPLLTVGSEFEYAKNKCSDKILEINGKKIKEIICADSMLDMIPGRYNYEFVDKDLVIILNNKTETIDKIIYFLKFDE